MVQVRKRGYGMVQDSPMRGWSSVCDERMRGERRERGRRGNGIGKIIEYK